MGHGLVLKVPINIVCFKHNIILQALIRLFSLNQQYFDWVNLGFVVSVCFMMGQILRDSYNYFDINFNIHTPSLHL